LQILIFNDCVGKINSYNMLYFDPSRLKEFIIVITCLRCGFLSKARRILICVFFVSLSNPYVNLGKLIFFLIVHATRGGSHLIEPQLF